MRFKVLVSAPYMVPELDRFRAYLSANDVDVVAAEVTERLNEAELVSLLGVYDGIICGDDRFTSRAMDAAPQLKVISKWGTGIDSIDQVAAKERGILVCNTPNAFTEPVADTVLGYILNFARNLGAMNAEMRQGKWFKKPSVALNETVLGVIGVGNIGKAVIRRARAFGMTTIGNDPEKIDPEFLSATGTTMMSKESLLGQSDFVSLNCTLNETSYHVIDREALALMKPTGIVINTARGPLVDESAFVAALEMGAVGGGAFDVFEEEPLPAESRLRLFDNVMLAPHNSNSSPTAWERVHENTIANLLSGLRNPAR